MKQNNEQLTIEKQGISVLSINDSIFKLLIKHKINTIKKLCQQTKRDLLNLGLTLDETKKIEIELQLQGLNLKNNL